MALSVAPSAWAAPPAPPSEARRQVEALLAELARPDAELRRDALEDLLELAPEVARVGAVPVVIEMVRRDPDVGVRELGLQLLGKIGPAAADQVVPLALELIEREQPGRVRGWAVYALGKMRPPIKLVAKRLIPLLLLPDDFLRMAVKGALLELDDSVLPLLGFLIAQAPEPYTRGRLAEALGEFGARARPLVPELQRLRSADASEPVRDSLTRAILRILPPDDPEVLRLMLAELAGASGARRHLLLSDLGKLGPAAVPVLRAELTHATQPQVRAALVQALADGGPAALGDLIRALADEDRLVRLTAAQALGALGPAAGPAVPALLAAETGASMREDLGALAKIGAAAIDPLRIGLRHADARIRERAAYGIGLIGPPAAPAVRALCAVLCDPVADVRQWAVWSIGQLGSKADYAIEDLQAALIDPSYAVRVNAVASLGRLGPGAIQALPDLVRLLADRQPSVAQQAAEVLGGFGSRSASAVEALVACLAPERNESIRRAAAAALGRIGLRDAQVLDALRRGLDDPKARVRLAAAEALTALGSTADRARVRRILRRAPDEAMDEDAAEMKKFQHMLEP